MIFSKKNRFTVGFVTLLLFGFANSHLLAQSQDKQIASAHQTTQNIVTESEKPLTLSSFLLPLIKSAQILAASGQNFAPLQQITAGTPSNTDNNTLAQSVVSVSTKYNVIDEFKKFKFSVNNSQVFSAGKLPATKISFNQKDLLTVLTNTRKYYQDHANADPDVLRTGLLGTQGVTIDDVLKTLDFMVAVLQEDIANNRTTRLQNANFINSNFKVIKWTPYNPKQTNQPKLRITKYAVFNHPGSHKKQLHIIFQFIA